MIYQTKILENGYAIEALEPRHAYKFFKLYKAIFGNSWAHHEIKNILNDERYFCLGAFSGRLRLLDGFLALRIVKGEAEIISIGVRSRARRKGLAAALLRTGIEQLSYFGVQELHLEVAESNEKAVDLYQSLGFETVNRRTNYYPATGTKLRMDALGMRLHLD